MHIDLANGAEIAALINDQDKLVAGFVNKRLPEIGQAIEMIRAAFLKGGRLIYAGAGTSGRLGVAGRQLSARQHLEQNQSR